MTTFIGIKDHMTQVWDKAGKRYPVTVLKTPPVTVTQVKSVGTDGYAAVQVGIGTKPSRLLSKPLRGHLKSFDTKTVAPRFLREIDLDKEAADLKVGQTLNVDTRLSVGDRVSATAVTKGKGFAGVMKRWGFKGGPKTHGQSDRARAPGSIGQGTDPGRIHKGKKMAGHFGHAQMYLKNLTVIKVDVVEGEIWLSGPVPGPKGGLVKVSVLPFKNKRFPGLPEVETEKQGGEEAAPTADQKPESVPQETAAESQETTSAPDSDTQPSQDENTQNKKDETKV